MASPFENPTDPVPSYEESMRTGSSTRAPIGDTKDVSGPNPRATALPLQNELANARTRRIDDILSEYVDPLLAAQGAAGLYRTTFILVPSTVSNLRATSDDDAFSTSSQDPEVVGFPQNDVVKLIRLKGVEHTMEFWRQPAVVTELESSMKARLAASGHRLYGSIDSLNTTASPTTRSDSSTKQPKKSVWQRLKPHNDDIVERNLGWRAPDLETEPSSSKIPTGMVQVSVAWKDILLRVTSPLGLFESKHGPALCLTVEVGT